MNLIELKNKTILLFGKSRTFSSDEFDMQLKSNHINLLREYTGVDISLIVDGSMMTPIENIESEKLYDEKKYEFMDINKLEQMLIDNLDENTLLMSLKLSRDKERLKSFILNSMISNELYFKLLKMYSWGDDDFFENDDNRDVSASFILRFYENIERNHNIQYATTGFMHLIRQTEQIQVLKAILSLNPIKYNPKMKIEIAMSSYCDDDMQEFLKKENTHKIDEALSLNKKLKISIMKEFLEDEKLGLNIAKNIQLTDDFFELFKTQKIGLALNDSLTLDMQKKLLALEDNEVRYALALNENIDVDILNILLKSTNEEIKSVIYENRVMPISLLEEAYKNNQYYEQLAKNENTPIDILYQLQLDSRYERFVKTNAGFGKHIQQENIGWLV